MKEVGMIFREVDDHGGSIKQLIFDTQDAQNFEKYPLFGSKCKISMVLQLL